MQRRAEEEEQKRKDAEARPKQREEEPVPQTLVYADELQMTPQERQQNRKFKKKDQYHLPDLDVSLAEMGGPNDPRVMSLEELENYARQFNSGEDINVYDFSKIDFNSPFFLSLPASDRYNILNAARLRSRLRMGLSKDQLDTMFPDRMAFSKFQIERVRERNELTQRLMMVNGMGDDASFSADGMSRVSGEKGREYVLVRNSGVEGGWALGVIGDKESGERNKPIDVDEAENQAKDEAGEEDEEDDFEDVPIEGLNRLPKLPRRTATTFNPRTTSQDILQRRRALYEARQKEVKAISTTDRDPPNTDSLFVDSGRHVPEQDGIQDEEDAAELEKAIAMSLEPTARGLSDEQEDDDYNELFSKATKETAFQNGVRGDRASVPTNASSQNVATRGPMFQESDEEDMEFEDAFGESEQRINHHNPHRGDEPSKSGDVVDTNSTRFSGPLPFEALDLGSSILGKKKMNKIAQDSAGGFEKEASKSTDKKPSAPLPPWFKGDLQQDMKAQHAIEVEDLHQERELEEKERFQFQERPKIQKQATAEVIDVDELDSEKSKVIELDSSEDDEDIQQTNIETIVEDVDLRMGDVAELIRAEPPAADDRVEVDEKIDERKHEQSPSFIQQVAEVAEVADESQDEALEWEESDEENDEQPLKPSERSPVPASAGTDSRDIKSASAEFEDVQINDERGSTPSLVQNSSPANEVDDPVPMSGTADQYMPTNHDILEDEEEEQYFSEDAEDAELMQELAAEAEEHARFASTLNNKSQRLNQEEYERELKALRTQQKKDRRDADEVTHVMVTECQQLLKLFGLPYITAPMEAEAQCAELVRLGLVDGIVTDDSDTFLFGGTRVYKNMFNQAKYVECYLSSDFEREFDLTRQRLIRIAHLLGSDYTEGIPGVGPVTALEILSEFPDGLDDFRMWWERVQTGALASAEDTASPFRKKFRRNSTKIFLPPSFPDMRVDQAYLEPDVDNDPSQFQWGVPDLDSLRAFLMATIGWSPERTDEVLVPVIRDMNRRENEGTQANITRFLEGGSTVSASNGPQQKVASVGAGAFAPRRKGDGKSKRMETALNKMAERARTKRKRGSGVQDADMERPEEEDEENGDVITGEDAVIAVPGTIVEADPSEKANISARDSKAKRKRPTKQDAVAAASESSGDESDWATKQKTNRARGKARRK